MSSLSISVRGKIHWLAGLVLIFGSACSGVAGLSSPVEPNGKGDQIEPPTTPIGTAALRPATFEDFCDLFATMRCDAAAKCCDDPEVAQYAPTEACRSAYVTACGDMFDSAYYAYDVDAGRQKLEALALSAADCSPMSDRRSLFELFDAFEPGQLAAGEPCTPGASGASSQCGAGLDCLLYYVGEASEDKLGKEPETNTAYHCAKRAEVGESCISWQPLECAKGLYCGAYGDEVDLCQVEKTEGTACSMHFECEGALFCNFYYTDSEPICVPKYGAGGACLTGVECQDVFYCSADDGTGVCTPKGTVGAPCESFRNCLSTLECDSTTGTCTSDVTSDYHCGLMLP